MSVINPALRAAISPDPAVRVRVPPPGTLPICLGPADILRRVWEGEDLGPLTQSLALAAHAGAPGPALDLATLMLTQGGDVATGGLELQTRVMEEARSFVIRPGGTFTVLALVTTGDFMANTPIDFLLADREVTLILHYVEAGTDSLAALPPHDIAFLAVAESTETRPVLERLARILPTYTGPMINGAPSRIAGLTRTGVADVLDGIPGLVTPEVEELTAAELRRRSIASPVLLRPAGSHAGHGLALVHNEVEAAAWLTETGAERLTLTRFVDYRDAQGYFAKYRIALIDGEAFASHMAVSEHWMVHYLNAGMDIHADRRAKEAAWMAEFDSFARRHATTFAAIADRLGLDYLGLDCAELPDGRLLLFEADVAMIVHALDDATLYPYKKPAMQKLFTGFETALRREARRSGPWIV